MTWKGLFGGQYRPLTPEGIEKIHQTSMRLWEEVGLEINSHTALQMFHENGAEVDFAKKRVRAGREWVMNWLKKAPSEVLLCGREEKNDLIIGGKRVHLGTGGTALNVLDLDTGERRRSTLKDCREACRVVDALDNIHFIVLPLYPVELPAEVVDVNRFYAGLSNSSKHIMGGIYTLEGTLEVIKMAEIIAGSREALRKRPFISMITCVMSPLKLDDTYTELMIKVAEQGIPLAIPAEPLLAATAPCTVAGLLTQLNVETQAGVVITQMANPGTPVLYASTSTSVDLKTCNYLGGSVEMGLINAGAAQMAQYYNLPYYGTAGMSDAKTIDVQCGYESAVTAVMVALSGANYIHDAAGLMEFAMTVSLEKYVIDNDILGMVMRAVQGIPVDEETLAFDVIERVGPGGHFLSDDHTVRYMRQESYIPTLADRQLREHWTEKGSIDARARAGKIAKDILANHRPLPIPDEAMARMKTEVKGLIF